MGLKDIENKIENKIKQELGKSPKPEASSGTEPAVEEKSSAAEAESSKTPAATLAGSGETEAADAVTKTATKAESVDEAEKKAAAGVEVAKKAEGAVAKSPAAATAVTEHPAAAAPAAGAPLPPAGAGPVGVQAANSSDESDNMIFPLGGRRGRTAPPETEPCSPCTDLITAAKRVLRDPKVNKGIGDWLLEAAKSDSSPAEKAKNQANLARAQEAALTSFANAVAGRDAVRAECEPCRGQLRLFVEFLDPLSTGQTVSQAVDAVAKRMGNGLTNGMPRDFKRLEINRQAAKNLNFQILDDQLRVAQEGGRSLDGQGGILVSQVAAGNVYVGLRENVFGGAEFIADFLATAPGGTSFTHYTSVPPSVAPVIALDPLVGTAYENDEYDETLVVTGGVKPYTFSIISDPNGLQKNLGITLDQSTGEISGTPYNLNVNPDATFPFTVQVQDSTGSTAIANCVITFGRQAGYAAGTATTTASGVPAKNAPPASSAALAPPGPSTPPGATRVPGYQLPIFPGMETRAVLFLRPPAALVRCFAFMEGDDCCGQGKQYVSRVAISALQGDNFIACKTTGASGCSGFEVNPGMYTFSAPQEIVIGGCNYTLASSSPVSAFLGAGQCCSDIYFSYKKKGNEILVISEIDSALAGDPYIPAKENFPGMQYLLLQEGNPSFAQQQTTTDGSAISFRNLPAGTYLLFCQAPATYGSQPVTPVYPADGRLSLRVFTGQTSSVPVLVKFRTSTTAPAVLSGYVRDDAGAPVPQQVIQVLNNANCLVAAGLTDSNGFYSIQIYKADNLTLVVGSQQVAVTQSQIQAAMQAVGTPPLPSPRAALNEALQTSELVTTY